MRIVPPFSQDIQAWAENIRRFLGKALNQLDSKEADVSASEDGVMLWDRINKYPVISSNNVFRQVATQQATPSSNVGSAGDVAGMIAWDASYIYVCVGTYNGSAVIWKRATLGTW